MSAGGSALFDRMGEAERAARRRAIDPEVSAFVSANAGSGKTTVLVQRIVRLLIAGVDPSEILALTYTRAAAAEMQSRVFATLGAWVRHDAERLRAELTALLGRAPEPGETAAARRLFAQALETPGGLKIQTIHAFFERLLHLFPFEAEAPPRFTIAEDAAIRALEDEALERTVVALSGEAESPGGRALARLMRAIDGAQLRGIFREALASHREAAVSTAEAVALRGRHDLLRLALGLDPRRRATDVDDDILDGGPDEAARAAMIAGLRMGGKTLKGNADDLEEAWREPDRARRAAAHAAAMLTTERKAYDHKNYRGSAAARAFHAESQRVAPLVEERALIEAAERTEALFVVVAEIARRLAAAKAARGVLSFDDVIERTRAMFARADAAYVLFRLDANLSHVLVDEAQDTAPAQWEVITRMTAEFFAGAGQRGNRARTVFAVGDEKQSIYRFQGARPESFGEAKSLFARAVGDSGRDFVDLEFRSSFRSAPQILDFVDAVFAEPERHRGLSTDPVRPIHTALRDDVTGVIELWPEISLGEAESADPFAEDGSEAEAPREPALVLAEKVAERIAELIGGVDGEPPEALPGDIMVLMPKRDAFFEALIATLKRRGLPVSGADRLVLAANGAVLDCLALLDVMVNREDDLALAGLLKSPLIGFDDDDLLAIAAERGAIALADALEAAAAREPEGRPAAARRTIDRWRAIAAAGDPFLLLGAVLSADGGRKALVSRFGADASDALDALLSDALAFRRAQAPSIAVFARQVREGEREVKREMSESAGLIRVMTVHAAKGLEAPVVFIAGALKSRRSRTSPLLALAPARGAAPPVSLLTTGGDRAERIAALRVAAEQLEDDEYRRLLYVAMTRAKNRLIVTGHYRKQTPYAGSWHRLIAATAAGRAAANGGAPAPGGVIRFGEDAGRAPFAPAQPARAAAALPPSLAAFLVAGRDAPLRPSGRPRGEAPGPAARRGRMAHRLLEALPADPALATVEAARRILAADGGDPAPDETEAALAAALRLRGAPETAALLAAPGIAEAPVAGAITLPDGSRRQVRGRIDRLVVTDDLVRIVDFKTGRRETAARARHVRQMALYAALIETIFAGRRVEASLVHVDDGVVETIPGLDLAAALAAIAAEGDAGGPT